MESSMRSGTRRKQRTMHRHAFLRRYGLALLRSFSMSMARTLAMSAVARLPTAVSARPTMYLREGE